MTAVSVVTHCGIKPLHCRLEFCELPIHLTLHLASILLDTSRTCSRVDSYCTKFPGVQFLPLFRSRTFWYCKLCTPMTNCLLFIPCYILCPMVRVHSMSHGTCPFYVPWYVSILCPMVRVHSMSHGTCPFYVPWYVSILCPTVCVHSMPHGTCPFYVPQYVSILCPTVRVHSMPHGMCPFYAPWYVSILCPMVRVHSMPHGTCPLYNLVLFSMVYTISRRICNLDHDQVCSCEHDVDTKHTCLRVRSSDMSHIPTVDLYYR